MHNFVIIFRPVSAGHHVMLQALYDRLIGLLSGHFPNSRLVKIQGLQVLGQDNAYCITVISWQVDVAAAHCIHLRIITNHTMTCTNKWVLLRAGV